MKELAVAAPLLVVATAAKLNVVALFAQDTGGGPMDPGIGSLIGNVGVMSVLIWYLWFNTTRTYPEMQRNFRDEARQARDAFVLEQQSSRQAFLTEQAQLRESFLREQRESRSHDERVQAELRVMFSQLAEKFRLAVHDTRDIAQVSLNKVTEQALKAQGDKA